ncbi:MAG TPA: methyl-accepting chemotaxis protein [Bryobacteraceae bacterium]|nr:methyl-accepting chemotaxis protein [Bryobacteraceae bacterium]
MPSRLTIGTKLLGSVGAMFALAGLQSYLGQHTANTFKKQLESVIDVSLREVELAGRIEVNNSEAISTQRGIVLAASEKDQASLENYEQQYQQATENVRKSLNELRPLLRLEEGKTLVANVSETLSQWQPHHEELLRQAHARHLAEADHIRKDITAPLYNKIAADAARLRTLSAAALAQDKAEVQTENSSSQRAAFGLMGLCLLVAAVVVVIVRRINAALGRLAYRMTEGAEQVASAATQVSSASQSLAQGSSEQAASLEETSSSSEEINSMTHKNAENSKVAAEFTDQVNQRVTAANESLAQMVSSMNEINTSSDKVSKIIRVIDEIAFQTNILALNAAVEAARAGEAGMGFAVVADEVRNLAQRCAQAARDTSALIEESLEKSRDGMAKLDHMAEAIRSITDSSAKVKTLVDEVYVGSQEQARGIEQIAKAIAQMEQVTQKNAANAEESASASEQLSAQARVMRAAVGELHDLVGGTAESGEPRTAATPAQPRLAAARKSDATASSLQALKSAVARQNQPPAPQLTAVMAAKPDRHAIPLDEDFKDF